MDRDTIALIAIALGAGGMLMAIIAMAAGFTAIWLRFKDRGEEWSYEELTVLFKEHNYDRMECHDHEVGNCCPAGCHALTENQYEHYARLITQESDDPKHG